MIPTTSTRRELRELARDLVPKQKAVADATERVTAAMLVEIRAFELRAGGAAYDEDPAVDPEVIEALTTVSHYLESVSDFLHVHRLAVGLCLMRSGSRAGDLAARIVEADEAGKRAAREGCSCSQHVAMRKEADAVVAATQASAERARGGA